MRLWSLSNVHTMQATASLLNCIRSWSCRLSSSSPLWSNTARKALALSLRGGGGGGASAVQGEGSKAQLE